MTGTLSPRGESGLRAASAFPKIDCVADAPAIETVGLSKTYGDSVRALVDLDLRVERGEVFGYLGPNGAGKSTTIRLLLDLIHPTSGRAAVFGVDARTDGPAARGPVGYLPGDLRLSDRLTAREELDSFARLRGDADTAYRDELCERLGVELDRPIRQLSRGNRQKVGLVQAFMHRPDLVMLDEPTAGLDPLLQAEVRALLRETAAEGRTVFLSSHSLDEVQHAADRVGIIRSGRLVDVDAVESLRERSLRHVTVTFERAVDPGELGSLDGVRLVAAEGATLRLSAPETAMDGLVKTLARFPVADLVVEPADLEEIFLDLYREADDDR
jgi:ABC-2 type transport system ATP-binding protein